MKKLFALLLAALMLLACVSAFAEEAEYPEVVEGIDFGGATITGLFRGVASMLDGTTGGYWLTNDVCGTDNIGDTVSDAVWQRNNTVSERLNIDLQWTASDGGSLANDITVFKNVVMSSADSFDFFLPTGNTSAGFFFNLGFYADRVD